MRELKPEEGLRIFDIKWRTDTAGPSPNNNERIEVFVAKNLIPSKQHLDEDEFIELKAYTLDELKEKILTGEIEDSKTVASLMAYAVKYGL